MNAGVRLVALAYITVIGTSPIAAQGRLKDFSLRLSKAEHRIENRRAARQAGDKGGDVLFGVRAEARLLSALRRYEEIVRQGGWTQIERGKALKVGDADKRVPAVRRHLVITGDLDGQSAVAGNVLDRQLHAAIIRFQTRHGLPNRGHFGKLTLAAMNVRAEARLAQLRTNLRRARKMADIIGTSGRNVVVNIPGYELQAMIGDQVMFSSRVIVGRIDRQTPAISVRINGVNLRPTWRVPPGITARDMVPKLQNDPDYFARENVRVLRISDNTPVAPGSTEWSSGTPATLKFEQAPGPRNALGLIRIDMPNKYVVYLHDTPNRELFAKPSRPFSSGCVRTEKIAELALWLLADKPAWNAASLASVINAGQSKYIKLTAPVPVHFVYLTSWVEPDGDVNFREDVYRRDNASPGAELYQDHVVPGQPPTP